MIKGATFLPQGQQLAAAWESVWRDSPSVQLHGAMECSHSCPHDTRAHRTSGHTATMGPGIFSPSRQHGSELRDLPSGSPLIKDGSAFTLKFLTASCSQPLSHTQPEACLSFPRSSRSETRPTLTQWEKQENRKLLGLQRPHITQWPWERVINSPTQPESSRIRPADPIPMFQEPALPWGGLLRSPCQTPPLLQKLMGVGRGVT